VKREGTEGTPNSNHHHLMASVNAIVHLNASVAGRPFARLSSHFGAPVLRNPELPGLFGNVSGEPPRFQDHRDASPSHFPGEPQQLECGPAPPAGQN
jgi:hypothetical protein